MTHTQTVLDLLSACREDDSDAMRLVLADAIQEDGDDARAELIRVQVELKQREANKNDSNIARILRLKKRADELLRDNTHWLSKPCPVCPRREAYRELGPCPTCGGTGDLFHARREPGNRQVFDVIARPDRGLIRVTARPERLWKYDYRATGSPRYIADMAIAPHPWLVAIASDPFVVRLDVEGKRPTPRAKNATENEYGWCKTTFGESWSLPEPIWNLLEAHNSYVWATYYRVYLTEADANHALSVALLRWATKGAAS